jgi:chitinase
MGQSDKRHIGRILLDGGFLSQQDLDSALEEQKHTKELLGQVLVKKGVLKVEDIKVPLIIQERLATIDNAVKIVAGERQLLGELLVQSGHITNEQLDQVIAEQQRCSEKTGEIFKRLGVLNEQQLNALLDFQLNQEVALPSPLRLGNCWLLQDILNGSSWRLLFTTRR